MCKGCVSQRMNPYPKHTIKPLSELEYKLNSLTWETLKVYLDKQEEGVECQKCICKPAFRVQHMEDRGFCCKDCYYKASLNTR